MSALVNVAGYLASVTIVRAYLCRDYGCMQLRAL